MRLDGALGNSLLETELELPLTPVPDTVMIIMIIIMAMISFTLPTTEVLFVQVS